MTARAKASVRVTTTVRVRVRVRGRASAHRADRMPIVVCFDHWGTLIDCILRCSSICRWLNLLRFLLRSRALLRCSRFILGRGFWCGFGLCSTRQ